MYWLYLLRWLVVLGLCCAQITWAEPLTLRAQFKEANLGPLVELFAEPAGPAMSLAEARALADDRWWQAGSDVPSFGFTPRAYWLRVSLFNSSQADLNLLLELGHPQLDQISFYQLVGEKLVNQIATGDARPFAERALKHREFLFPVPINQRNQTQVFLRVQSAGAMQFPLRLYEPSHYFIEDESYLLQQGAYYGLVLAAVLYNLFLLFSSRAKLYLFYIGYVLGFSFTQLSLSGFAFQYLWPEWVTFNQSAVPFWMCCTAIFASLNASELFTSPMQQAQWRRGLFALAGAGLVLLVACPFIPYLLAVELSLGLAVAVCASVILLSGHLWWQQRQLDALGFHLAWWVFLIGIGLFSLNRFGVMPRTALSESSVQVSSALQILLLSYLLAQRLTRDYKARFEAEFIARASNQKYFIAEQQHALALEKAVQEKTSALHDALCQVSKLNMDLARISITDSLTGLYNRRHFDQLLETEIKRAAREGRPISLVLMDADHFKTVNDTFGHQAGDECLKQLADIITQALRKPPDHAFRYGGEEMAILLPGTDLAGASVVAEKVRAMVEAAEFVFPDFCFRLTLSLGVSGLWPNQDTSSRELFDRADQALYRAKQLGRNRVATDLGGDNTDVT